jgi:hypothetical protein
MKVRFRGESQLDSRGVEFLIGQSESLRGRQILSDPTTVSNTILHCNIILEQVFFYPGINVLVKEKKPDHWCPASSWEVPTWTRGEVELPRRSRNYSLSILHRNTFFRTSVFLKRKVTLKGLCESP